MDILDYLFPKTCVSCGKKGSYFCPSCLKTIKTTFQVCPVCERASPFGQTHPFCRTGNSLAGVFSFFVYDGIIRSAIHQLKYKFVTDLEKEFWGVIKTEIEKREEEMIVLSKFVKEERPVMVPIPLYWKKQNIRGFNQSLLIAKRFSDWFMLPILDKLLIRKRNVESQTKLTQKEREQNVKGIFKINSVIARSINDEAISVILVDDVWTTGSTMKEATRVLKEGGIKKVWGITIAR